MKGKTKSDSNLRWLILFLNCIMMIGNYYCYDIPASLHTQLQDFMANAVYATPNNFEILFSLLYTVYSIPNIILPFFGGFFVDRFGVRVCLLWFVTLILLGQSFFSLGVYLKSWGVMYLGRVLYGLGGESLGVANGALLSEWFKGREMAFAFGLNLSVARLGSVFNNLLSPYLAAKYGIKFSFFFGIFLCFISGFSVIFVVYVDKTLFDSRKRFNEFLEPLIITDSDGKNNGSDYDNVKNKKRNIFDELNEENGLDVDKYNANNNKYNNNSNSGKYEKFELKTLNTAAMSSMKRKKFLLYSSDDERNENDHENDSNDSDEHELANNEKEDEVKEEGDKLREEGRNNKEEEEEEGKANDYVINEVLKHITIEGENTENERDKNIIEITTVKNTETSWMEYDKVRKTLFRTDGEYNQEYNHDISIAEGNDNDQFSPDEGGYNGYDDNADYYNDYDGNNYDSESQSNRRINKSINRKIQKNIDGRITSPLLPPASMSDVLHFSRSFWILCFSSLFVYGCIMPFNNVASSLLLERNYFVALPPSSPYSGCHLLDPYSCQDADNPPVNCPSDSHYLVYRVPLPVSCVVNGESYDPFTAEDIHCDQAIWYQGCGRYHCEKLRKSEQKAAAAMSVPYLISACFSPILGKLVDQCGYRAVIATTAPLLLLLVHTLLGVTRIDPVAVLVAQGLAYSSFAAVIWPSIPLVVDARFTGLGYGVVTSVQNAGLAVFPLIIASLFHYSEGKYIPNCEYFFMFLSCVGVVIGVILNWDDYYHGHVLNDASSSSSSSSSTTATAGGGYKKDKNDKNNMTKNINNMKNNINNKNNMNSKDSMGDNTVGNIEGKKSPRKARCPSFSEYYEKTNSECEDDTVNERLLSAVSVVRVHDEMEEREREREERDREERERVAWDRGGKEYREGRGGREGRGEGGDGEGREGRDDREREDREEREGHRELSMEDLAFEEFPISDIEALKIADCA